MKDLDAAPQRQPGQSEDANARVAQLCALELRLLEPAVRATSDALTALLAPDFVEIGSGGHIFDRAAIIAALRDEQAAPPVERTVSDLAVRFLAETIALVTYRVDRRDGRFLRSSIWRLNDGRWQMAFHQGTRAADG